MLDYLYRIERAIWFRSKFKDVLASGIKRGTLRMGRRVPAAEVLPVILAETRERIGDAHITGLAWLRYGDLPRFPSILEEEYPHDTTEIDQEMKVVYPTLAADDWVTFYGFTFVPRGGGKEEAERPSR